MLVCAHMSVTPVDFDCGCCVCVCPYASYTGFGQSVGVVCGCTHMSVTLALAS